MNTLTVIPLVNWGMGAIIIGVFALVCIAMALVVYKMANSDKKRPKDKSQSV
jgi:ABC-type transport system involved in cytochrome bd biosynthesis fused ATPase/permease subunit